VTGTLEKLSKLNSQYGFVSNKTTSLHEACEQMLIDQTKLSNLADELENKVSYFLEYEKIQSQLSSPTLSVHGELFRNILDRLDKCIDYMQSHVSNILSRCLFFTFILNHVFTASIQGIVDLRNQIQSLPQHCFVIGTRLGPAGPGAVCATS